MTHILSLRGAALVLVACTVVGVPACRKAKTSTDDRSDQPADSFGPLGSGKGDDKPPSGGAPSRPALPAGWQEFKHPEGVYSIFVPAQPKRPRMSSPSLDLARPLQPNEARESIYEIAATQNQPFTCTLQLTLFHPSVRVAFNQFEAKPRVLPPHWTLKSDNAVTWGGLAATELVVEKSFPGHTPSRAYSVMRWCLTADRMYQFLLERTDRMPDEKERAAFFDSFKPGN